MDNQDVGQTIGEVLLLILIVAPLILKFAFGVGAKRVAMLNSTTGQTRDGFYGFSWTYFLFGWWVPLLRGELAVAALHLLFSIFTLGIWQVIVSFMYNRQYTDRKIAEGFRLADNEAGNAAAARALGLDLALHLARRPA